jgi:beta-phosphoglucomutase-like phosphatase (HAD superfamily)
MSVIADIPGIGPLSTESGFVPLTETSDGQFRVDANGVRSITATGDRKVEFVAFDDRTLAYVNSSMGYPAYYPLPAAEIRKPIQAVLMDLDGTSVRSETFWIWIIQMTTASLLDNLGFELCDEDLPYVSGHSVSEHLQYCIGKYCPDKTVEEARRFYFEHTRREMANVLAGKGRPDAFQPAPGLKSFLTGLKSMGVRIGLVSSGLHEKAWPEIVSAFRTLNLGDPLEFYDAIITAGYPMGKGDAGTLGELSPKPHPWLYAEASRVGLGIPFEERHTVVGIEDSGAGVCSIRLAGFAAIGLADGNIIESGTRELCCHYAKSLEEVLEVLQ